MNTWIALLRGINVGGRNVLKMKDLAALLEGIGCIRPQTYLQSGNAVFKSAESSAVEMGAAIESALADIRGVGARALVLGEEELRHTLASNPFPQAEESPSTVHLFFLSGPPKGPDFESLSSLKAESESFVLAGNVFYLHAPDGIGRSKLAARVERLLGVDATARNWRTVSKVLGMAHDLD